MHISTRDNSQAIQANPLQLAALEKQNHRDELADKIITLAGHLNAAEYRLIKLLDEFDQNDGWHGDGCAVHRRQWRRQAGPLDRGPLATDSLAAQRWRTVRRRDRSGRPRGRQGLVERTVCV